MIFIPFEPEITTDWSEPKITRNIATKLLKMADLNKK